MPTHAQVCGVVCRGTLTHTSTDVCSHMRTSTKHMCTLISFFFFFSLCVKRYFLPLNFKALCSTDKHTHTSEKSTTMPLNGGDLDLGHQLHNVHLQQRDKKCLPCFHLLWCWYTDFPIKPNRALSRSNLVGRSNEQSNRARSAKRENTVQFALSWLTFIDTFVWILRVWSLAVTSAVYLSSQVPIR